jgi:3-deoxy-D-manno-octulosonic-acid transferase
LLLYNILIPFAWILLQGPARLLKAVRKSMAARIGIFEDLSANLQAVDSKGKRRVLIHCASMGEYEAIRPLARKLRAAGNFLILSFFSTSGPEHLGDDVDYDVLTYLPFDTARAAAEFARLVKADVFIITKHDLWLNHVYFQRKSGASLFFVNANFHKKSRLNKWWMRPYNRFVLSQFDLIAPVSELMSQRYQSLLRGIDTRIKVLGETRFDRVVDRVKMSNTASLIPQSFSKNKRILIAGSSWKAGEIHLLPAFAELSESFPDLRLLLVPHQPFPDIVRDLESRIAESGLNSCLLSAVDNYDCSDCQILIVDQVGILSGLYRLGELAYVGGGFTTGVHSVIEAAAFGLPVLFGPRHGVSQEAMDLLECGAGFEVSTKDDFIRVLKPLLENEELKAKAVKHALELVNIRTGATDRILKIL